MNDEARQFIHEKLAYISLPHTLKCSPVYTGIYEKSYLPPGGWVLVDSLSGGNQGHFFHLVFLISIRHKNIET